jgi:hypothetical protein
MRVETKCVETPEEEARVPKQFPDKDVTDFDNSGIKHYRTQGGLVGPGGDHCNDQRRMGHR